MPDRSETIKRLESNPQEGSQYLLSLLERFFEPVLLKLDRVLDRRLVRTMRPCLVAILRLRNNPQVLGLAELGSYLQGYEGYARSATAGTKRVGKVLRSVKWTVGLIDSSLLEKADAEVARLKEHGKRILCLWDGSVVEKAESETLEGVCPVLSSLAKRRQRTKRGVIFNWPAAREVAGHGDAMERGADRRDEWRGPGSREQMVDDTRGVGHEGARDRRRALARRCQEVGPNAGARL